MAIVPRYRFSISSRQALRVAAPVAWIAVALCGCSINLGSLTPSADKEEPKASASQQALEAKLKKNEDEVVKLRDAMLKDCDEEIAKVDEAIKKARSSPVPDFSSLEGLVYPKGDKD